MKLISCQVLILFLYMSTNISASPPKYVLVREDSPFLNRKIDRNGRPQKYILVREDSPNLFPKEEDRGDDSDNDDNVVNAINDNSGERETRPNNANQNDRQIILVPYQKTNLFTKTTESADEDKVDPHKPLFRSKSRQRNAAPRYVSEDESGEGIDSQEPALKYVTKYIYKSRPKSKLVPATYEQQMIYAPEDVMSSPEDAESEQPQNDDTVQPQYKPQVHYDAPPAHSVPRHKPHFYVTRQIFHYDSPDHPHFMRDTR